MGVTEATGQIEGLIVRPLKVIGGEKGSVLHFLKRSDPTFCGFGEVYFSETLPGEVKAWKRHDNLRQHFVVPVGRLRLVVHDCRENSKTQGNTTEITLGRPDQYCLVCIPEGVWYGFQAIAADVPTLIANCIDLEHTEADSHNLPQDDAAVPYAWSQ